MQNASSLEYRYTFYIYYIYDTVSDITNLVSRECVIVSPAATGPVQSDTPPVSALTTVLGQGVEILIVVHPKHHYSFVGEEKKYKMNLLTC